MLRRWADNRNQDSWASRLRRHRFAAFLRLLDTLPVDRRIKILDVGGSPQFWVEMLGTEADYDVILPNTLIYPAGPSWIRAVAGNARAIPFHDQAFDVVFSNSVIEHVGVRTDQQRMASEITRVGRRYVVQTPNRYFPIEPHFLVPGFQFLPIPLRAWLLTRRRLGWHDRVPSFRDALDTVAAVRLLSARDLRALFPGSTIVRERVAGLVKSITACGGWT